MLDRTHRFRRAAIVAAVAIATVALSGCGDTGPKNKQNALRPKGPYANKILDLTQPFFWVAVIIGVGVVGGTIYIALRFRVKPGEDRAPKQVHGNTVLEVSWTIVPAVILAIMAVPTIATIFDLAKKPAGPNVVHITVTARQWWWEYHYDDGSNIETANEMHIPAGVPVSLTLQGPPKCSGAGCYANGVIHSFWVPELNGKKDVVPGRTHFLKLQADEPGTYDATYRAIAVEDDVAVATGSSTYLTKPGGPVEQIFDNCFVIRFDRDGRCTEFTEWFMERP